MPYLIASLLALAFGPLLAVGARRFRASTIALDSFVLVVLGGLVALHILPGALERGGFLALVVAVAAFALTGTAERSLRSSSSAGGRIGRRAFFVLALCGLGFHGVVDGIALTGADAGGHSHGPGEHDHADGTIWAIAVLLHRVPVAISLWWIVAPLIGLRTALATMAVLGAGTLAGYLLGAPLLATASEQHVALFEALLCGTLMHIVLHADLPPPPKDADPWLIRAATLIGVAGGVGTVWLVEGGHSHDHGGAHEHGVFESFVGLALESAPALLVAFIAVGLAQAYLPRGFVQRATTGRPFGEALRGVALGIPLPICSCGVVPLYRDLVRQGSSLAAAIAFLIATPELEIAAILLTWELLGPQIAVARLVAAVLIALLVALAIARFARGLPRPTDLGDGDAEPDPRPAGGAGRLRFALHAGLREAVDETAPWILLGLAIAAFLTPLLDPTALAALGSGFGVPLAALVGMPLYVCASGSTPLAAVLVAKGLSPGAAVAFLLTGPATNLTTFGVLSRLHDRRTAVAFGLLMFAGATGAGWLTDLALGTSYEPPAATVHPHPEGTTLQWICLAAMTLIFVASLLRQGIRRFLGQLFESPPLAELTARGPRRAGCGHDDGHGHAH